MKITEADKIVSIVKSTLAEHIGVDTEDIEEDDSFVEDLHMNPTDLSDFIAKLETEGVEVSEPDFTDSETVGEFIENLISKPEIN
jgi:acyl carrier protein